MYHEMAMAIEKKIKNMNNVEYYTSELKSIIATKNYKLLLHLVFCDQYCSQLMQCDKSMVSNVLELCLRNDFEKGYQLIKMFE